MGQYSDLLKAQTRTKPPGTPETQSPRNQASKEARNVAPVEPRVQVSQETGEPGNQELGKQGVSVSAAAGPERDGSFDINERADKDATFQFAERELDALDMLCIELKRELGEKPKKYDIVRAGLQHVIEDYHQQREKSLIIRRLRRKR